jgi:hypothetical protein
MCKKMNMNSLQAAYITVWLRSMQRNAPIFAGNVELKFKNVDLLQTNVLVASHYQIHCNICSCFPNSNHTIASWSSHLILAGYTNWSQTNGMELYFSPKN